LALGLCPLAFLRRLVPPRQQQIPLAIPPAQQLLSLILITAFPSEFRRGTATIAR